MNKKNQNILGFFEIILAGVGFGFLGIFGRLAFSTGITVGELLTWRFTLAAIILWLSLFLFRKDFIKLSTQQILISSGLGIGGYAVLSTMYFNSIQGVSVAVAAMLLFTFPMFVNLGSVLFFKEKMKASQWLSLFLAMSGLVMLLWGEMNVRTVSSVGWGLAAALTYSGYVLISGRIQKNVEPLSSSLYVITSAAFALWGFHHPEYNRLLNFEVEQYLYIIGIAVFSTILPLTLFLSGMQKLSSSKASIIVMIEPVVATIAGWIILGETLRPLQMAGAFIIFLSLIFVSK